MLDVGSGGETGYDGLERGSRSGRIPLKIFDRNSRVRFHKLMTATGLQTLMHDLTHGLLFNHS